MIKVIIAGGRDFNDLKLLQETFHEWFKEMNNKEITIISGGARGADKLGEQIAHMYGLKCEVYPANWDRYGKSAGYKRNELMASKATHLLAAWDNQSKGTKHMIDIAFKQKLEVLVINY